MGFGSQRSAYRCSFPKVKGKWLLSYNDDRFIRGLYEGQAGIELDTIQVSYSIAREGRQHAGDLLVRNYPLLP
jgi:hypothetical protein